jgi:hypothetical protein
LRMLGKRSAGSGLRAAIAYFAIMFACACSPLPPHPEAPRVDSGFSNAMTNAHLRNLQDLGPRLPESQADEIARRYLAREFRLAGASTERLEIGEAVHLVAELSGDSPDGILLVAPYPVLGSDEWVDLSGAVLLLELARVMGDDRLPYTVRMALADTRPRPVEEVQEPRQGPNAGAQEEQRIDSDTARQLVVEAGESLASALDTEERLGSLRAVIAFEPRAGAISRMSRDLRSHPVFRSLFWETAATLGHSASFPPDAGWRSPPGLQVAFQDRGIDQVLALVDETTARAEIQYELGALDSAGDSRTSGLKPVGSVTLEALSRLMHRFERVDAFAP